jgi:hypothetical protein
MFKVFNMQSDMIFGDRGGFIGIDIDPIFDPQIDLNADDLHAGCEGCPMCDSDDGHDHSHEAVYDPATGLYTVSDIYVLGSGQESALGSPTLVSPYNSSNKPDFDYDAAPYSSHAICANSGTAFIIMAAMSLGHRATLAGPLTPRQIAGFHKSLWRKCSLLFGLLITLMTWLM